MAEVQAQVHLKNDIKIAMHQRIFADTLCCSAPPSSVQPSSYGSIKLTTWCRRGKKTLALYQFTNMPVCLDQFCAGMKIELLVFLWWKVGPSMIYFQFFIFLGMSSIFKQISLFPFQSEILTSANICSLILSNSDKVRLQAPIKLTNSNVVFWVFHMCKSWSSKVTTWCFSGGYVSEFFKWDQ